jgi:hypothetical protein
MNRPSLAANATISHYRILSRIGAGGMAEEYLAQDMKLRFSYAHIKARRE